MVDMSQTLILFCFQVDILEHKETQLKGTERRVHSLSQQVEQLQAELGRCSSYHCKGFLYYAASLYAPSDWLLIDRIA